MRLTIILLLFIFHSGLSLSQSDYIVIDTTTNAGIDLKNGGSIRNAQKIGLHSRDSVHYYSPMDVKEYGLNHKHFYVSKSIQTIDGQKQVFLERLTHGKIDLYYYPTKKTKSYFIETENLTLTEISLQKSPRQNSMLPEPLNEITSDCPGFDTMSEFASYHKKSFTLLMNRYNTCTISSFPHIRFGLVAGATLSKLHPKNLNNGEADFPFFYGFEPGSHIGLFFDVPIHASPASIHTSLNYSSLHYTYAVTSGADEYDLVVNATSLQLPATLRYTFSSPRLRPLVEAGGVLTYYMNHENVLYHATVLDSLVEIKNVIEPEWIGSLQAGYMLGLGFEYVLNGRHSLFFETRLIKQYNLTGSPNATKTDIQISIGINL